MKYNEQSKATEQQSWSDARLELLHDHYKDTHSYNREREKQRDRLFFIVIALFGALFLEVQSPTSFQSIFSELGAEGAKLDLKSIPVAAIMSVTWTLLLTYAMRYCQASIHIERQYTYLHKLEDKMTSVIRDDEVFCREGKAYLTNYPLFSWWSWFFYTAMFPLIITAAAVLLLYFEWTVLQLPIYHQIYDTIAATAAVTCFILYRTLPWLVGFSTRWRTQAAVKQHFDYLRILH